MSELRKQFEALPEIEDKLEHLFFEHGFYYRKYDDADQDEYFVNGAWYAFQEQQKKIDNAVSFTDEVHSENWQEAIRCISEILK